MRGKGCKGKMASGDAPGTSMEFVHTRSEGRAKLPVHEKF